MWLLTWFLILILIFILILIHHSTRMTCPWRSKIHFPSAKSKFQGQATFLSMIVKRTSQHEPLSFLSLLWSQFLRMTSEPYHVSIPILSPFIILCLLLTCLLPRQRSLCHSLLKFHCEYSQLPQVSLALPNRNAPHVNLDPPADCTHAQLCCSLLL